MGRAPELQFIGLATMESECTGSLKKVPYVPSIECRALPPMPQVMTVCLILDWGHRYEICSLIFYRGVFLKNKGAQSALMGHYSIEKMVTKNMRSLIL